MIPTESYGPSDAARAIADASTVYDAVKRLLDERQDPEDGLDAAETTNGGDR